MATATVTKLKNFIDGEFVDPAEGETEEVLNPATGEPIAEAPLSTAEDVERAVAAARKAFDGWATDVPGERALALLKLADSIEEHADELADLEAAERGQAAPGLPGGRDPADGRPAAVLRRRGPLPGGARVRRVPGGLHVDHPPRAGRGRSARSPPGTTR